jgi:DNA polymerase III subunit epsilon
MNNVLIIDTETTGLDPAKDKCIEVAAIVYSLEHATVIESYSSLLPADNNPCEALNRIPSAALQLASFPSDVWSRILVMASDNCSAILAHNADFDRGFVCDQLRNGLPWICTKDDIMWPEQSRPGLSLVALALDHGLGVADAHRAMSDCQLIARLLTRAQELGMHLDAMLARGLRPKATMVAVVPYLERHKARNAGFHWNEEDRQWQRKMAVEDATLLPFLTLRKDEEKKS